MSNTALELSPEELKIIEDRRAKEQLVEDRRVAGFRKEWDDRVLRTKRDNAAKRTLVDALRFLNITGVFTITESSVTIKSDFDFGTIEVYQPKITFEYAGRDEQVRIDEHYPASNGRYYRSRSNGYKFHLYGGFNDYKDRWYKRASTVIERVVEMQEALVARKVFKAEQIASHDAQRQEALKVATKTYPNAQIEVSTQSNIVTVKRDDVGTLTLNYIIDYTTNGMTLVYNSVKLADDLHTEILAKFEA